MAWVWAERVPASDRGLAYGDGAFETLRLSRGRAPLRDLHRDRLTQAARRLAIPFDPRWMDAALEAALGRERGDGVLKLILTRGVGGRGYAAPQVPSPRLYASLHPWQPHPGRQHGLQVGLCTLQLARQPVLAGMKHLNRLEQVLARQQVASAGWDEGLLCDDRGHVIEGTACNLFALLDGHLWTPALTDCGVAGVAREQILSRLAPALGLSVQVSARPLSQLGAATEWFLCNSVAGVLPVTTLGAWTRAVGPVTRQLQTALDALFA